MDIWLKQHPQDIDAALQNGKQVQNRPKVIIRLSKK